MSKKLAKELEELHGIVWNFREHMEPYWATPNPLDSLRYAFTEAADAMDAFLRLQRPDDSRNNVKNYDMLDELADCAIMLLTAVNVNHLKEVYDEYEILSIWHNARIPETHRLETLCKQVADATFHARNDVDEKSSIYLQWITQISFALGWIASYPGLNLEQRVKQNLGRIALKHLPQEVLDAAKVPSQAMPWLGTINADWLAWKPLDWSDVAGDEDESV